MSVAEDFLDVFYGKNEFTNFGAMLLRLIAKADSSNRYKLRALYPTETYLYEWWMNQTEQPTSEQVETKAKEIIAANRGE